MHPERLAPRNFGCRREGQVPCWEHAHESPDSTGGLYSNLALTLAHTTCVAGDLVEF